MEDDKITRRDVDDLSAKILINLGLINAAAIGTTLAAKSPEDFSPAPFAVGLTFAIVSQVVWYVVTAIEYAFQEYGEQEIFCDRVSNAIWHFIIFFLVIGSGCVSAACVVYGCFKFLGDNDALLHASLLFVVIFFSLFYILIRKSFVIKKKLQVNLNQ